MNNMNKTMLTNGDKKKHSKSYDLPSFFRHCTHTFQSSRQFMDGKQAAPSVIDCSIVPTPDAEYMHTRSSLTDAPAW